MSAHGRSLPLRLGYASLRAIRSWLAALASRMESAAPVTQPVRHFFDPGDLDGWDPSAELGYPGEFPYTRGIQPTMYRGRVWTMRQYAGFGTAAESNRRYRYLLDQGVSGLSVALITPKMNATARNGTKPPV